MDCKSPGLRASRRRGAEFHGVTTTSNSVNEQARTSSAEWSRHDEVFSSRRCRRPRQGGRAPATAMQVMSRRGNACERFVT